MPVRHGPVAGSVPSPKVIRLHARSQVGAGHTSTVAPYPPTSRVPPIGSTPIGSADSAYASAASVSASPVTQPTAPPLELLGSINVAPGPVL